MLTRNTGGQCFYPYGMKILAFLFLSNVRMPHPVSEYIKNRKGGIKHLAPYPVPEAEQIRTRSTHKKSAAHFKEVKHELFQKHGSSNDG